MIRNLAVVSALVLMSACGDDDDVEEPTTQQTAGGTMGAGPAERDDRADRAMGDESMDEGAQAMAADGECDEPKVYFATDSAQLDQQAQQKLDRLVQCVRDGDIDEIEIVGHTDPRGTQPYNEELGRQRAQAVAQYLREQGLSEPEMEVRSEGESQASSMRLRWPEDRRAAIETE